MRTTPRLLGRIVIVMACTLAPAMADGGQFWVVGGATGGCRIVTVNPVVDGTPGSFATGPYRSEDDAKLAMSGISVCQR